MSLRHAAPRWGFPARVGLSRAKEGCPGCASTEHRFSSGWSWAWRPLSTGRAGLNVDVRIFVFSNVWAGSRRPSCLRQSGVRAIIRRFRRRPSRLSGPIPPEPRNQKSGWQDVAQVVPPGASLRALTDWSLSVVRRDGKTHLIRVGHERSQGYAQSGRGPRGRSSSCPTPASCLKRPPPSTGLSLVSEDLGDLPSPRPQGARGLQPHVAPRLGRATAATG